MKYAILYSSFKHHRQQYFEILVQMMVMMVAFIFICSIYVRLRVYNQQLHKRLKVFMFSSFSLVLFQQQTNSLRPKIIFFMRPNQCYHDMALADFHSPVL